jgi:peptide-methionine (S)-S-oxide reductase
MESATFGGGCFWCTEAIYKELRGVTSVTSGYSGGSVERPSYEQICTGRTGHAEVIRVDFDPAVISFEELLDVFFQTHDPTTLNRQGADTGTQYRSVVFYHDQRQREIAEEVKRRLDASGAFGSPIVTEISPLTNFFSAEDYHQDYFELNPRQPYCRAIIRPKMDKFAKAFAGKLKSAP